MPRHRIAQPRHPAFMVRDFTLPVTIRTGPAEADTRRVRPRVAIDW